MYVHYTRSPKSSLAEYDSVLSELGSEPIAGRKQHYAGEDAGALVTVDVWESRADADRFAAERLFPAFERLGLHPMGDTTIVAFEAERT
jgi:hypothetical protein